MSGVEDAAFAFAVDPTQSVVVILAGVVFFRLVRVAHLRVIDAGQHMKVVTRPALDTERVRLVIDLEGAAEHCGERTRRVVDLINDMLRIEPVELEVTPDHAVEVRPRAYLRVGSGLGGRRTAGP